MHCAIESQCLITPSLSKLLLNCFHYTKILMSGNLIKANTEETSRGTKTPGTLTNQIRKAGNQPHKPCGAKFTGRH